MRHAFLLFIFVLLLLLGGLFFWRMSFSTSSDQNSVPVQESVRTPPADELIPAAELSQSSCENSGGRWNECGSACRTQPEATCIELCVPYCECQTSNECPTGFSCGDFIQEVGICL